MEFLIVALFALLLVLSVHASFDVATVRRVFLVLLAAFGARLAIHLLLLRSGAIGYGGDNQGYERLALQIVTYWESSGFRFVTAEQIPSLHSVAVPCNIFALIIYVCGGAAPLACTAFIALVACALCIVMYKFARIIGADERSAFLVLLLTAFLPVSLVHTSDMFKDGVNAFLVMACLALAASNVQRFGMAKVVLLVPLLWALWHVRPYMVFMCSMPLLLGVLAVRRGRSAQVVVVGIALLLPLAALGGDIAGSEPAIRIQQQLEWGQDENVRGSNARDDSGVAFDDGGNPWGALHLKIAYTLLAPFPWTGGGLTMQLGKIEALGLYYLIFCAVAGARWLWRRDRTMLLLLVLFVVPSTIAYATTMANIGLIFRQRMPIVLVITLLAAMAWTKAAQERGARTPPLPAESPPVGRAGAVRRPRPGAGRSSAPIESVLRSRSYPYR